MDIQGSGPGTAWQSLIITRRISIMVKQPVRASISDFIKMNMGSQFVIPVYQRNYSWNPEKETKAFMDDLLHLVKDGNANHFIGIIIYTETKNASLYPVLQIVDGQQRLTTCFIFLLALRKAALARGETDLAGMIDDYYIFNKHTTDAGRIRLKPAAAGDSVFAKLAYGLEDALSHAEKESYVYRNYVYILARIEEVLRTYSLQDIMTAPERMDLLQFPLSPQDDVQQIFESINATGAPLTAAELIRNFVLMNHPDDVQERYYMMYWKTLEECFPQPQRLEEFFRSYLAVKTFTLPSRKDVYPMFKEYWAQRGESTDAKLKELNIYASVYRMIYEGPCEDKEAEEALCGFRANASRVPASFLMEAGHMFRIGQISGHSFAGVVRLVDSYLTRRALCGMENNVLAGYFPILLRSVLRSMQKTGQDIYDITVTNLIAYNRGKANAMPSDDQLRARLKEVNAYSLPVVRPVLDRIEHDGSAAKVDTSGLNIEHIMPQHANAYWYAHSGTKDADEYAFYANLIGNLTLCASSDNVEMGNEDFDFKKKVLERTMHIRMNSNIIRMKTWNKDTILNRCDRIADAVIRLYPFVCEEAPEERREDDILVLSTPTTNAKAIFHHPGRIEVLSGTRMKPYGNGDMKKMKILYNDLTARGILHEKADGQAVFDASAEFNSLNEAARFLMHRGGENISSWTYEDGRRIGGSLNDLYETQKEKKDMQEKKNDHQPYKKKPIKKKMGSVEKDLGQKERLVRGTKPDHDMKPSKPVHKNRPAVKKEEATKEAPKKHKGIGRDKQKEGRATGVVDHKNKKNVRNNKKPSRKQEGNKKFGGRKGRGFAPQATHPKSERQSVNIVRFAGQE